MSTLRRTPAVLLAAALLGLSACSSSSGDNQPSTPASPAAPASPAPTSRTPTPAVSPLTGQEPTHHPVIAVKIDDTAPGRPQAGIGKADIVYIEQVEGGLTRLLAVFNHTLPTVLPVRSVRPSDPELALQFGHILFVASGGSRGGLAPLKRSPLHAVLDGGPGFSRDPHRPAPYNLRVNLTRLANRIHGPKATDIGLNWSRQLGSASTKPGKSVQTRVGATPVTFRWDSDLHKYVRIIDGRVQHASDGSVIATPNVVVQFCRITPYRKVRDVLGNPAFYTHTVGRGRAVVFRDGRRIDGTWRRRSVDDGTTLTTSAGKPLTLAPGGAWFALVATNAPLH